MHDVQYGYAKIVDFNVFTKNLLIDKQKKMHYRFRKKGPKGVDNAAPYRCGYRVRQGKFERCERDFSPPQGRRRVVLRSCHLLHRPGSRHAIRRCRHPQHRAHHPQVVHRFARALWMKAFRCVQPGAHHQGPIPDTDLEVPVHRPICPTCDQPAELVSIRVERTGVRRGNYVCSNEHIWEVRWLLPLRSTGS